MSEPEIRVWRVQLVSGEVWYLPFGQDPRDSFGEEIETAKLGIWVEVPDAFMVNPDE